MNHIQKNGRGFALRSLPTPAAQGEHASGVLAYGLAPARKAGFVLIIVLAILLLVTILAVTYLRVMRLRTLNLNKSGGNIDVVASSVLDQALTAIAADMPVKNSGQENYDYPWTDASATLLPATLAYPTQQSGLFTAGNPARDDAWLASSMPEGGNWPHLSNIMGSFLDVATADLTQVPVNPTTLLRVPSDKLSANMETNVPFGDPRLADADGDGIGDSFWFYPPRPQIETTRYVAAVYIEDLSAKINLNTALPLRAAGAYPAISPKGLSPSDVDLAAMVSAFGATDAELTNAVKYRSMGDVTPAPWNEGKRNKYWGVHASHCQLTGETAAPDTQRYSLDDEYELRFHGGLNDHYTTDAITGQKKPVTTTVESAASGLPNLLRATNTTTMTESSWQDAGFADATTFLKNNPRRWLTTLNGDAARQVGLDATFLTQEIRYNLNIRNDADYPLEVGDAIGLRFFRGKDGLDNTADDYPMPAGFARFVPLASERPTAMAYQWMCNIRDARDKNNLVTKMGDAGSNGGWYGFEPLPLLSEVYMQRSYHEASGSTGSAGNYTIHCASNGATASYAFELANPYHFPIKLTNVDVAVQLPGVSIPGAARRISTDVTAAGWPDKDADNDPVLLPGHRLILWKNGSSADANTDITAMINNAVALDPAKVHKVPCSLVINDVAIATLPATSFVRVDLLCYTEDKTGVASGVAEPGAYSTLVVPWLPQSFTENTARGPFASGALLGFRQVNGQAFGIDQGPNLLQCRPARWPNLTLPALTADTSSTNITGVAPNFGDTAIRYTRVGGPAGWVYNGSFQSLGATSKPLAPFPAGRIDLKADKFYFNQQALFGGTKIPGDQLSSLMDLLRIPMWGMRGSSTVHRGNLALQANGQYVDTTQAAALYEFLESGVKPLSSLCVSIDPGTSTYNSVLSASGTPTTSHGNVPFGWLLPCLYDTVNPAMYGGLDVDSDGTKDWFNQASTTLSTLDANGNGLLDWPGEMDANAYLVPGRLNLNTAPQHVLAEALPIPNAALRSQLAAAIVARRAGAPTTGTRASSDRGLSSVFEILQDAATLPAFVGSPTKRFDLVENLGCLTQTTTCRSDFFAVHILVLGYDCNDFSLGASEQRRMMVIVSRSQQTTPGNKAQLKYWSYIY